MPDYVSLAAGAKRLLGTFGRVITVETTTGTFDPVLGVVNSAATTSFTANGVVVDYDKSQIDGESVLKNDKRLLLDSDDAPSVNDVAVIGSIDYTIVSVRELNPGGTVVIYDCQIRH